MTCCWSQFMVLTGASTKDLGVLIVGRCRWGPQVGIMHTPQNAARKLWFQGSQTMLKAIKIVRNQGYKFLLDCRYIYLCCFCCSTYSHHYSQIHCFPSLVCYGNDDLLSSNGLLRSSPAVHYCLIKLPPPWGYSQWQSQTVTRREGECRAPAKQPILYIW